MKTKPVRLAVITDVHYGEDTTHQKRRCSIGHILLERAVSHINLTVKPDVVLVLGDLVDNGSGTGAQERWEALRKILTRLRCPYLIIPGNHDGDPGPFYQVFDRPGDYVDIGGVRFLGFVDAEAPGYNASRTEQDIQRFYAAREGFSGPIVAFQHVCLYPTEPKMAPYNYTNADAILAAMNETGVALSISGHYHPGCDPVEVNGTTLVTAPGLCESPFPIMAFTVEDGQVHAVRQKLAPEPLTDLDPRPDG